MRKWNLSLGCLLIATSALAAPAKPQPRPPPQTTRQAPPPPPPPQQQNRQQRPPPQQQQPNQQRSQKNPNAQKKMGKAEFRDGKWHVTNDW